ncbi:hypothetical protein TBR22_A40270 [Luteitalea sp. TBR-22]|uniref:RDD family protein n=1 Tax=Luteitalea sp. TBR-22 TaxID=2802971 RepID=UPI001AF8E725|nr:RDD family protein [Luteitalea sp. TBR-22]BCS34801.1 hypothetical protein TBR22_A40270 [Luteitalea sp. TBR-22]
MTSLLRMAGIGLVGLLGVGTPLVRGQVAATPAVDAPATQAPATTAPAPTESAPRPTRAPRARTAPPPAVPATTVSPEGAVITDTTTGLDPCEGLGSNPVFRLGQDEAIGPEDVFHEFVVVMGNLVVQGHVCDDVSVTLGDVRLASTARIDGSLVVVGGALTVEPGAVVGRELVLVGGTLDAPQDFHPGDGKVVVGVPLIGQRLRGAVPYLTRGLLLGRLIVPDLWWIWVVVGVVFFVQLVLNLLFPQATLAATGMIAERPVSTFLAGVLVLLLTGPIATLLAVTVIGLAALPVLFAGLVIAWIVGRIAVARWIGTRLFPQDDPDSRLEATRSLAIGAVVITIAYMIPLLGLVVFGLTGVLGLGAAMLAFVRAYRRENPAAPKAPRPVPPVVPPTAPPAVPPTPAEASLRADAPADGLGMPLHSSAPADTFGMPAPAFAGGLPPVTAPVDASADGRALLAYPRASFAERAAAFALDVLLVAVTLAMFHVDSDVFLPCLLAYHVAFWTWKATTVGGIICQVRVARVDGAPLRLVDALVRGLVGIFSLAIFGLGALWILRDEYRQAWHDKVAGTVVVRVPRDFPLP